MKHPLIAIVFVSVFYSNLCWSQIISNKASDIEPIDASPKKGTTRALSMGGITLTTSTGVSALNGNIAGLPMMNGLEIQLDGAVCLDFKSGIEKEYYEELSNFSNFNRDYKKDFHIRNIGTAYSRHISNTPVTLSAGVGYRRFYDWNRKSVTEKERIRRNGTAKERITDEINGLMNMITFGFGGMFFNKFSIGFSINKPVQCFYKKRREDIYQYIDDKYKHIDQEEWDVTAENMIQFGGMIKITSELTFGMLYTMNYAFTLKNPTYFSSYFHNGQYHEHKHETSDSSEWEIPTTIDFGLSYRVKPNLLLAFEMRNRPWNEIQINERNIDHAESGNAVRFGIEYGDQVLFRAGFAIDRLPIVDDDQDPVNLKNIAAGIGYRSDNFNVDVGLCYRFAAFHPDNFFIPWYSFRSWEYHIREWVICTGMKYFL